MNEKTYILSPLFSLPAQEEIIDLDSGELIMTEEIGKILRRELFFLSNDKKDQLFLINPTIHQFLQSFGQPRSMKAVVAEFARRVKCHSEQIRQAMQGFFNEMRRRGVIVDTETAERIQRMEASLPEEKPLMEVGQFLDDYEISAEISMRKRTELYLARHRHNNQQVAIKIARINPAIEEEFIPRINQVFGQEFQLMQEIGQHPLICRLLEYNDQNPRRPYAVMEYIEGDSLRDFLAAAPRDMACKLRLIAQILEALAYVQRKNILHGDIHASNFMVTTEENIKLIDFDLANHTLPQENEILKNGAVYNYIPPERLKLSAFSFLKKRTSLQSEVFQTGLILYLIIYGQLPFKGFTWKALAQNILHQAPAFPPLQEEIPPYLIELISKCLEKLPQHRFTKVESVWQFFQDKR